MMASVPFAMQWPSNPPRKGSLCRCGQVTNVARVEGQKNGQATCEFYQRNFPCGFLASCTMSHL